MSDSNNNQSTSYSAAGEVTLVKARRSFSENLTRTLKSAPPTAWFGMIVITAYLFVALFAPLLAPHGEAEIFPLAYAPWSDEFILGTDALGRDVSVSYTHLPSPRDQRGSRMPSSA